MVQKTENKNTKFEDINAGKRPSIVMEFWYFLKHNKKWWLLPIIIILLLLSLIILLSSTALAPFIYPLF